MAYKGQEVAKNYADRCHAEEDSLEELCTAQRRTAELCGMHGCGMERKRETM